MNNITDRKATSITITIGIIIITIITITITGRKATSLSAASRIADFLGAEMVKDKG